MPAPARYAAHLLQAPRSQTIRQYELEDFIYLYRGYKALGGNSFIDRIKSEIDEWEAMS